LNLRTDFQNWRVQILRSYWIPVTEFFGAAAWKPVRANSSVLNPPNMFPIKKFSFVKRAAPFIFESQPGPISPVFKSFSRLTAKHLLIHIKLKRLLNFFWISAGLSPNQQWWAAIIGNLSVKAMQCFFFPGHFIGQSDNLIKAFRFEAMNQQIFFYFNLLSDKAIIHQNS
jgi:hypothetical protein